MFGMSLCSPSWSSLLLDAECCRRNSVFVGHEEMFDFLFQVNMLLAQKCASSSR